MVAYCYANGEDVPEDHAEAAFWYRKAAEQGDVKAQARLGCYLYEGKAVAKDVVEAVYWLRKAAEKDDACAQTYLAGCYENGVGVPEDKAEAANWYRKAAAHGENSVFGVLAQGMLKLMEA